MKMNKVTTLITTSLFAIGLTVSSVMAQSAPQASDKAKESMGKMADKMDDMGKSENAKMNAEQKKMEGQAKAEAAKMKEKPPSDE